MEADAWYGLVRAQLGLHHSRDAYASAELGLSKSPQSAGAQAAAGLAMFRHGDLAKAEEYFRAALKIQTDYPGGLKGMASIYSATSQPKSARDLWLLAYRQWPDDPELIILLSDALKGADHIKALETALARLDPASDQARGLRVRIANDRAAGSRRLMRLESPYKDYTLKLFPIMSGQRGRGFGVDLEINHKQTVRLAVDAGSSGISLSPKIAEKAGLQTLSGEASEAKGFGDQKAQPLVTYLASEIRAGDLAFADYPVSVYRSAADSNWDGLMGPDVFRRFLIRIDYWRQMVSLKARPEGDPDDAGEPVDWTGPPEPDLLSVFSRFGDRLAVPGFD